MAIPSICHQAKNFGIDFLPLLPISSHSWLSFLKTSRLFLWHHSQCHLCRTGFYYGSCGLSQQFLLTSFPSFTSPKYQFIISPLKLFQWHPIVYHIKFKLSLSLLEQTEYRVLLNLRDCWPLESPCFFLSSHYAEATHGSQPHHISNFCTGHSE